MTKTNKVAKMNSQVTKELAALAWQRAYAEGDESGVDMSLRVARQVVLLLATPAPTPDAGGGVEAWFTEDYLTDKSATTYDPVVADRWRAKGWPVTRLVSALQASAMVVPDGWQLVPVEMSDEMHAAYLDQYGRGLGIYWIYKAMLAASPAPGDSQ